MVSGFYADVAAHGECFFLANRYFVKVQGLPILT